MTKTEAIQKFKETAAQAIPYEGIRYQPGIIDLKVSDQLFFRLSTESRSQFLGVLTTSQEKNLRYEQYKLLPSEASDLEHAYWQHPITP